MSNQVVSFVEYSKSDYLLVDSTHEILGFAVYDRDGEHLGHVEELLVDNSKPAVTYGDPATRKVSLVVINVGGVLNHDQIVVPFEALGQIDQVQRQAQVNYPKEFFTQEMMVYRGLDLLDQDATGHLYGLYEMNPEWFDERRGADPEHVKYG